MTDTNISAYNDTDIISVVPWFSQSDADPDDDEYDYYGGESDIVEEDKCKNQFEDITEEDQCRNVDFKNIPVDERIAQKFGSKFGCCSEHQYIHTDECKVKRSE